MADFLPLKQDDQKIVEKWLDIVSKVILRHADLTTTQRDLGNVSDFEAIRWIENLHG